MALVTVFVLLLIAYQFSQNGRYQYKDGQSNTFLDTRTGVIYASDTATYIKRTIYNDEYGVRRIHLERTLKMGTAPIIVTSSVK